MALTSILVGISLLVLEAKKSIKNPGSESKLGFDLSWRKLTPSLSERIKLSRFKVLHLQSEIRLNDPESPC